MSSETEETKIRTESPPLFNYLRQEIPIDEMRDYASPKRLACIDVLKGFAIICVMLAHTSAAWLSPDWQYIYGIVFMVMDILGPSLFIFLSALSVVFSTMNKKGILPDKVIRNRIFSRGAVMIVIGIIINPFTIDANVWPFPLNLWGLNIIMFMGISQIFSYYALKLSKKHRAIIGAIIIFFSPMLRYYIYLGKDDFWGFWLLHFIITSPAPTVTLLPWLAICFITTIFGEFLHEGMTEGTVDRYVGLVRLFTFWGVVLILIGLFVPLCVGDIGTWQPGWALQTPETLVFEEYWHIELLAVANQQSYYHFPGMPLILIRSTAANTCYNIGAALLIISISLYLVDVKRIDNDFTHMLKYYGKVSLSLFLLHYVFLFLFLKQIPIWFYVFYAIVYLGFMGFFMYIWMEYGKGVGSPEWIMIQIGRIGQKTGETVKKEVRIFYDRTFSIVLKKKQRIENVEFFHETAGKKKEDQT